MSAKSQLRPVGLLGDAGERLGRAPRRIGTDLSAHLRTPAPPRINVQFRPRGVR
jgi:hypothetical protein